MQGGPPEPCRRRHCPAQAGWPHRRARRQALRDALGGDGATRRGLTPETNSTNPDRSRSDEFAQCRCVAPAAISICLAISSGTAERPIPDRRSSCCANLAHLLVLPPTTCPVKPRQLEGWLKANPVA